MRAASRLLGKLGPVLVLCGCLALVPTVAGGRAPAMAAAACASPAPATTVAGDGTGAATPAATPAPAGLATPVTSDCLTVTLTLDKLEAGPRVLTLKITGADGKPVAGADVTLRTQSLEMNHGISSYTAKMTKPGVYVARDVSLGMSGKWQVEVTIGQPDQGRAGVVFIFSLNGPKM